MGLAEASARCAPSCFFCIVEDQSAVGVVVLSSVFTYLEVGPRRLMIMRLIVSNPINRWRCVALCPPAAAAAAAAADARAELIMPRRKHDSSGPQSTSSMGAPFVALAKLGYIGSPNVSWRRASSSQRRCPPPLLLSLHPPPLTSSSANTTTATLPRFSASLLPCCSSRRRDSNRGRRRLTSWFSSSKTSTVIAEVDSTGRTTYTAGQDSRSILLYLHVYCLYGWFIQYQPLSQQMHPVVIDPQVNKLSPYASCITWIFCAFLKTSTMQNETKQMLPTFCFFCSFHIVRACVFTEYKPFVMSL